MGRLTLLPDYHPRGAFQGAARALRLGLASALGILAAARPASAHQTMSRGQAIEAALARGPRLAIARADTAVANAQLITARSYPNPSLSATYTKDAPQYHIIADIPFDLGGLRSARVGSAQFARQAALLRYQFARATIIFDTDTTYTRALAAVARAQLSRRNALDADSLRRIAEFRRDAGDGSELEVQLALVNAGQQANLAVADSLALITTLLDLQTVIGLTSNDVVVALADSLVAPPNDGAGTGAGTPLQIAAAEAALTAADFGLRLQRRSIWTWPSLQAGFETRVPDGSEPGLLPTFGLSIPLPFANRNRGPILAASAERERARAELDVARLESRAFILRALRERDVALSKIARDRLLLESGSRVVAMSIRAYQEGAAPLANVLESQRTAREVLGQYIDDVAAGWIALSAVRLYTLTSTSRP
jgi:outer membrane protein, heavy metal efflux system